MTDVEMMKTVQAYMDVLKLEGPSIMTVRSEREWDSFFRRLEERFLCLDLEDDRIKKLIVRRLLRGPLLISWATLSKQHETYEATRDAFYKSYFVNSDLFESMRRSLDPRTTTTTTTPTNTADATPGTVATSGDESSNDSINPLTGFPKRHATCSVGMIRNRVMNLQEALARVANRYGETMPGEDVWVKWALGLMRPSLLEAYQAMENKPTTLDGLYLLVEPESNTNDRRPVSNRRFRRRPKKSNTATAASSPLNTAATANNNNSAPAPPAQA